MTATPRYDLIPFSCVNNEVVRFNRQLKKRMEMCNTVKILETDLKNEYFTKHGLHLNSYRKEQIALKLAAVVKILLNKNRTSHIYLHGRKILRARVMVAQWKSQVMKHVNYPQELMY
jgi:hypothetical protein